MENADVKNRLMALLIDYCFIILWGIVLFGVNAFVFLVILNGFPSFDELGMNLISLTMILPVLSYSIITESSRWQGTFGKRMKSIKVSSSKNKAASTCQIIIRNTIKFLPWQLAHMMIFRGFAYHWELPPFWMAMLIITDILPFIWIAVVIIRKDHRGIHDLLANTIIVKSK